MRFWDSSALVPLLVDEAASAPLRAGYKRDPEVLVWWGTEVEAVSALTRLEREESLNRRSVAAALLRLDELTRSWREVQPAARVRQTAIRLLRVHPLRAADALQLAAAVTAAEDHPETLPFVTLDDRLAHAAEREGFVVEPPTSGTA